MKSSAVIKCTNLPCCCGRPFHVEVLTRKSLKNKTHCSGCKTNIVQSKFEFAAKIFRIHPEKFLSRFILEFETRKYRNSCLRVLSCDFNEHLGCFTPFGVFLCGECGQKLRKEGEIPFRIFEPLRSIMSAKEFNRFVQKF